MAGRLPPTDASEARALGITEQAYLDSLDGKAITKDAYLIILPKQGPARKAQTPAWMKAIDFEEEPEPTAADRLALMQANLKSQGIEAPESTEAMTLEGEEESRVMSWPKPPTQAMIDEGRRRPSCLAELQDDDEEDAEPTQAVVDEFTRQYYGA